MDQDMSTAQRDAVIAYVRSLYEIPEEGRSLVAWLASWQLREHVERPKHELVANVERDHGP
jgi:hypothetical protein